MVTPQSGDDANIEADGTPDEQRAAARNRFVYAIAAFDAANAQDPNRDVDEHGVEHPRELLYAQRMSVRLLQYRPDAPETLRLAARAQHLRRWTIPRASYPQGRSGYHRWRNALKTYHADTAGAILREAGYDDASIARVRELLAKENLRQDADAQCLEDVVCLVFLQFYCADFARPRPPEKVSDILRKTWAKMSPRGREAALSLPLPAATRARIEQALQ